jgi:hypothetical protein
MPEVDLNDSTPYAIAALAPVTAELYERLDIELTEPDSVAIASAISKAFMAGFREGTAAVTFGAAQQGVTIRPEIHSGDEFDAWADRYSDSVDD